jgi:hypothetical protein
MLGEQPGQYVHEVLGLFLSLILVILWQTLARLCCT